MRKKHRNNITSLIYKISHKLGHPSLYCELEYFDPVGVTWQKRKALRARLAHSLQKALLKPKAASRSALAPSSEKSKGNIFHSSKEREWQSLTIPGGCPVHSLASISIAHCPVMGGFVFSLDKNLSIGLDIELVNRVSHKVVRRIADEKEQKQAPDRVFLWTAKEASFKCLTWDKGVILPSHCRIFDWVKFNKAWLFSFSFSRKLNMRNKENKGSSLGSAAKKHCNNASGIRGFGGAFQIAGLAFAYAQVDWRSQPAHQK